MLFKKTCISMYSLFGVQFIIIKKIALGGVKPYRPVFSFFFYKFLRITAPAINIAAQSKQTAWDVQFLKQDAPPQEK